MVMFRNNLKEFTKNTVRTSKWIEQSLNTRSIFKNQLYFYILAMNNCKMQLKNYFTITSQNMKYLGINLAKYVQEMYTQNCQIWWREMKKDLNGKTTCSCIRRCNIMKMSVLPNWFIDSIQSQLKSQQHLFKKNDKVILKILYGNAKKKLAELYWFQDLL